MRRPGVRQAAAFALGCALAWPALSQGLFDDNEARRRVELLGPQVEAKQKALEDRLGEFESSAGDRSALLDLAGQLEGLRSEIARMRGQIEVLANQIETADRRQKDLYVDIDTRLRKLEQAREQQAAASADKPPAASSEIEGATPGEAKAYQAALDQFKLGNYPMAVSAMQGFLVTYPGSSLAPNAQYWIGMAYSGQRDYKSAIAAQRKLLAAWPDSPKAPDAMLSIASAQETMGDRRAAQKTLEELIARYPSSSAATSAKQRLAAYPVGDRAHGAEALNDPDPAQLARLVTGGAFLLAFIFGAVGNKTRFCTMGAVSDWVNMGDLGRMRMWLLAIAVALLGSSALQVTGVVDLSKSIYPAPNFTWLSYVVGGFLFGVGMTLGSGCGSKTLIRIGAGSLKSVIVYVFLGIAAYMTLRGLLGAFRVGVLEKASLTLAPGQDLPSLLSTGLGLSKAAWTALLAAVVGGAILAFVYASREFRSSFDYTLGGVVTGLVVVGGWYVSGHLGHLAEDPNTLQEAFVATNSGRMESFSFVSPMAYTLDYLMLWTDKSRIITYGIASAAGVIAGSAAYALATHSFRWEGFRDAEDTASHIIGGMLMGFGGICALGCTIGQAISGVSTLALGSIITFAFIVLGSAATMKLQYWRIAREG